MAQEVARAKDLSASKGDEQPDFLAHSMPVARPVTSK
jgi:hypothetical protein